MEQFYMIVLGASGVLLILMLIAVGLLMYSAKSTPEAPIRSPCPDYWEYDGIGCKLGTVNHGELTSGIMSGATVDYDGTARSSSKIYYKSGNDYLLNPTASTWASKYKGLTEVCAKGKWATDFGIVWDGYTNTNEC